MTQRSYVDIGLDAITATSSMVIVGATPPPFAVDIDTSAGAPLVRAYASRLADAYVDFRERDLEPRFLGPLTPSQYDDLAEKAASVSWMSSATVKEWRDRAALERKKFAERPRTADQRQAERDLTTKEDDKEQALKKYQKKISSFDLFGDSPNQAWKVLQGFEDELERERDLANEILLDEGAGPLKSKKPEIADKGAVGYAKDVVGIVVGGVVVVSLAVLAVKVVPLLVHPATPPIAPQRQEPQP